jgi:hypothetical protein
MKKIFLILSFIFIVPTLAYSQKSAKAIEQHAKEFMLKLGKMNESQKKQASKELEVYLKSANANTKTIWLLSAAKYLPKESLEAMQKRLKDEEAKKNKKIAETRKVENTLQEQEQDQEEGEIIDYEDSNYAKIINSISEQFDNWLIKGEFEKTADYKVRTQSLKLVFDTICENKVISLLETEVNSERMVTPMLGYGREIINSFRSVSGPQNIYLDFKSYDADKECYNLNIQYKELTFKHKLFMSIEKAKQLWIAIEKYDDANSGYSDNVQRWREFTVEYPVEVDNWVLLKNNLYPTKVVLKFGDKDNTNLEVKFPLNNAKKINISSSDMKLRNYHGTPLIFDFED